MRVEKRTGKTPGRKPRPCHKPERWTVGPVSREVKALAKSLAAKREMQISEFVEHLVCAEAARDSDHGPPVPSEAEVFWQGRIHAAELEMTWAEYVAMAVHSQLRRGKKLVPPQRG